MKRLIIAVGALLVAGCAAQPSAPPQVQHDDSHSVPFLTVFMNSLQEGEQDPACQPPRTVEQLLNPAQRLNDCP